LSRTEFRFCALEGARESLAIEGLENVVNGIHLKRSDCVLIMGSHEDNHRLRLACQSTGDLYTIASWHLDVEENEIG
jgi:hypothetical protein